MMIKFKILLVLLLLQTPLVYATQKPVEQLQNFLTTTKTLTSNFKQVIYDESGKIKQTSYGVFRLSRPGKFRWNYQKPFLQEIVSNNGKVWFYDADLEQVTVKKLDKSMGSTPALLLTGDVELEKEFILENQGDEDGLQWIKLVPKNIESNFKYVLLGLNQDSLAGMELSDNFGQLTRIYFSNVRINPALKTNEFNFTPPKGVDVLEDKEQDKPKYNEPVKFKDNFDNKPKDVDLIDKSKYNEPVKLKDNFDNKPKDVELMDKPRDNFENKSKDIESDKLKNKVEDTQFVNEQNKAITEVQKEPTEMQPETMAEEIVDVEEVTPMRHKAKTHVVHHDKPKETHHDKPKEVHHDKPKEIHHDRPKEIHHDSPKETHHDRPKEIHHDSPKEVHHDKPKETHHDKPKEVHHDSPKEKSHDKPKEKSKDKHTNKHK